MFALLQMIILFIIVIIGFISHKTGLMGGDFDKKLSKFVIQLTCPCLLIASTMGDKMPDRSHIPALLGISLLTYIILISLAYLWPHILRIRKDLAGMYQFMLVYSNVGFIGYPIVASIFGSDAVFYACILNVFNTLSVFIWGEMFILGESVKDGGFRWKLLVSPAMVATYISIVIVFFGWKTPETIAKPLTMVGNMTVPASLLIIGSSIAGIPAKKMMGTPMTFIMCALKLILLPLMMYYIFTSLGVEPKLAAINSTLIAMPVASFGTMFCLRHGKDETAMSQGTFWSTLLSILTIPLLAILFG